VEPADSGGEMATSYGFSKRQKERQRQEKRREKELKRKLRREQRALGLTTANQESVNILSVSQLPGDEAIRFSDARPDDSDQAATPATEESKK
jgi:hypothetical protein